jgi:hypothetical protein
VPSEKGSFCTISVILVARRMLAVIQLVYLLDDVCFVSHLPAINVSIISAKRKRESSISLIKAFASPKPFMILKKIDFPKPFAFFSD